MVKRYDNMCSLGADRDFLGIEVPLLFLLIIIMTVLNWPGTERIHFPF